MRPGLHGDVLYGARSVVVPFVGARIAHVGPDGFGAQPYRDVEALGVVRDGRLIGGVVFHDFRDHDVEVSIAFDDRRWMRRRTLARLFAYPFVQLGCSRLTAITAAGDARVRKLLEGLGFQHEGTHPRGLGPRLDAVSYGLMAEDCRWLKVAHG